MGAVTGSIPREEGEKGAELSISLFGVAFYEKKQHFLVYGIMMSVVPAETSSEGGNLHDQLRRPKRT